MELRARLCLEPSVPRFVGLDVCAGSSFTSEPIIRCSLANATRDLQTLTQYREICRVGQIAWVDNGVGERVAGVDVDVPGAERLLDGGREAHGVCGVDCEQELNLGRRCAEELDLLVIDGLEPCEDRRVLAGNRGDCILVRGGDIGLEPRDTVDTDYGCKIDVRSRRVDE